MVDPALLVDDCSRIRTLPSRRLYRKEGLGGLETEWVLHPEEWAGTSAILICALSCHRSEPDDGSSPSDPHALVAPFARRNHYAAAVEMLGKAAAELSIGLEIDRKKVRLFSNSRMPEKPLLIAAGLGALGANGLAQVKDLGSNFVIAGAVIPVPSAHISSGAIPAADPCGTCRRCIDACPVGAIVERGFVDPDICLQGPASRPGFFDPAVKKNWEFRLYGCQNCQSVCPRNSGVRGTSTVNRGEIGPSVSISKLLSLDTDGVRAFFRGTALGMRWISPEALVRNALIAAGNRGDPSLKRGISRHTESGMPFVVDAARWALEKCG